MVPVKCKPEDGLWHGWRSGLTHYLDSGSERVSGTGHQQSWICNSNLMFILDLVGTIKIDILVQHLIELHSLAIPHTPMYMYTQCTSPDHQAVYS